MRIGSSRLRWLLAIAAALLVLLMAGCRTLGYYTHVGLGHAELMASREPIADLLADPETDAALRDQLQPILQAREFASARLLLPRNRSYTLYSALDRPFVTWNVFAAGEFSVEPLLHCFPVAGCVGYRGYFDHARALAEAERLAEEGYETWVGGVRAYSTLGWFNDPVISSMPLSKPDELVGTIFHELAHQQLYARGDSAFNESYAEFVEQQGVREWRQSRGLPPESPDRVDYRPVIERVLALRGELASIYSEDVPGVRKREEKQAAIAAFRADYAAWRQGEGRDRKGYDEWVAAPIDNAKLVPFGLYDQWQPVFERLFADVGGDWQRFHERARALAELPHGRRQRELERLLAEAGER